MDTHMIEQYIPICKAITQLLNPLTEVVIHDLDTDKIVFISGALSNRAVGEDSNLDINPRVNQDELQNITYPKLNFDGRLIKSISVPLMEKEQIKALLCINCDVSLFSQMQQLASLLLPGSIDEQPESLFKSDWKEKLHWAIHRFLKENSLNFNQLTSSIKKDLIHHLYEIGAFNEKNAADYMAEILKMGRATIFKYIKEIKNNELKNI